MANNTEEKLFSQFPPVSTEQWEAVITADLKGADYQKNWYGARPRGSMSARTTGPKTSKESSI